MSYVITTKDVIFYTDLLYEKDVVDCPGETITTRLSGSLCLLLGFNINKCKMKIAKVIGEWVDE